MIDTASDKDIKFKEFEVTGSSYNPIGDMYVNTKVMHGLVFTLSVFINFSLYEGRKIDTIDYSSYLKELVDICVLCNDSNLSYNEVSDHVIVT